MSLIRYSDTHIPGEPMGDIGKPLSASVSHPAPEDSLDRLAELPTNWDGYGSPPIGKSALQSARRLIEALDSFSMPMPEVRPVSGGGIQFEWRKAERELEVEILPDGSGSYLAVEREPASGRESANEQALPLDQPGFGYELATWLLGR